jgi:hypothetical protein
MLFSAFFRPALRFAEPPPLIDSSLIKLQYDFRTYPAALEKGLMVHKKSLYRRRMAASWCLFAAVWIAVALILVFIPMK